jgi:hypothetical protein
MNSLLKKSQLSPLKDGDANKSSGYLKTPLVVRSQCGRLDYLSPLGVLMVIQQSMECQKTTLSTTPPKPKRKQETVYKQNWAYSCQRFEDENPGGVADALGRVEYQAQPTSENDYASRSRGLTMHQYPNQQGTPREGILTASQKPKRTGLYRLNFRKNT